MIAAGTPLAPAMGHDNHPGGRRRAPDRGTGPTDPGRRVRARAGSVRWRRRPRGRAARPTRAGPPRRADAEAERARGLPAPAGHGRARGHPHRHAHRGGEGGGSSAGPRRRRGRVPDQAVLAAGAALAGPHAGPGGAAMGAQVVLSQALSLTRDLRAAYDSALAREQELAGANERLLRAHQQSLGWALEVRRTYARLQHAVLQSLLGLSKALETKHDRSHGHGARVAALARRLALAAGLPPLAAETIANAGLLHDLGKVVIPETILTKPGPLTTAEWELVRRHPLTGAQILAPLEFFTEGAVIVLHHHERLDGSGYPDGLRGDAIPLGARVVAIADVYDAMVSDRVYRERLGPRAAIEHLRTQAGRQLDARLTRLFIELVESDLDEDAECDGTARGHAHGPARDAV